MIQPALPRLGEPDRQVCGLLALAATGARACGRSACRRIHHLEGLVGTSVGACGKVGCDEHHPRLHALIDRVLYLLRRGDPLHHGRIGFCRATIAGLETARDPRKPVLIAFLKDKDMGAEWFFPDWQY
jgi:hypothetical protein